MQLTFNGNSGINNLLQPQLNNLSPLALQQNLLTQQMLQQQIASSMQASAQLNPLQLQLLLQQQQHQQQQSLAGMQAQLAQASGFDMASKMFAGLPQGNVRRVDNFPSKLMRGILSLNPDDEANIVSWLPDNQSFVIIDPQRFSEAILHKYFKKSKYNSFVRKLHRWGFTRLTTGGGYDCFHHPMFRRNDPNLCQEMRALPRTLESKKASERKARKLREEYERRLEAQEEAVAGTKDDGEEEKPRAHNDDESTDDEE